jgi:hypothetical protein
MLWYSREVTSDIILDTRQSCSERGLDYPLQGSLDKFTLQDPKSGSNSSILRLLLTT